MSLPSIRPRIIDVPWPPEGNERGLPVRRVWRLRRLSATEQDAHPVVQSLLLGEVVARVDADELLTELAGALVSVGGDDVEGVPLEERIAWLDEECNILELRLVYSAWISTHVQLSDSDAPSSSGQSAAASTSEPSAAPASAASGNGNGQTAHDTPSTTPGEPASAPSTSPDGL